MHLFTKTLQCCSNQLEAELVRLLSGDQIGRTSAQLRRRPTRSESCRKDEDLCLQRWRLGLCAATNKVGSGLETVEVRRRRRLRRSYTTDSVGIQQRQRLLQSVTLSQIPIDWHSLSYDVDQEIVNRKRELGNVGTREPPLNRCQQIPATACIPPSPEKTGTAGILTCSSGSLLRRLRRCDK